MGHTDRQVKKYLSAREEALRSLSSDPEMAECAGAEVRHEIRLPRVPKNQARVDEEGRSRRADDRLRLPPATGSAVEEWRNALPKMVIDAIWGVVGAESIREDALLSHRKKHVVLPKHLRYRRPVAPTVKVPTLYEAGGSQIDNQTSLIIGRVSSGTPPDSTSGRNPRPTRAIGANSRPKFRRIRSRPTEFDPSFHPTVLHLHSVRDDCGRASAHKPEPAVPTHRGLSWPHQPSSGTGWYDADHRTLLATAYTVGNLTIGSSGDIPPDGVTCGPESRIQLEAEMQQRRVVEVHADSPAAALARSRSSSRDSVQASPDLDTLSSDSADSLRE
ncbi:hypothetical protein BHE74_00010183 [Ensete ventricosum]|nr:hypothetical protein BHE74_00010183 [Ensete ventricosum]